MNGNNNQKTTYTPVDNLPYRNMTEYMASCTLDNHDSGIESFKKNNIGISTFPMGSDDNTVTSRPIENVIPDRPEFQVPANPLLPPEYQEILNYENIQYLNGFLRSQIGKYIRVTQLIGSESIDDQHGYLVGVGLNYILLQELETGNIIALDYYTIKEVYIYHNTTKLPSFAEI